MSISDIFAIGMGGAALLLSIFFYMRRRRGDFGLGEGPMTSMELSRDAQLRQTYTTFKEQMISTLQKRFENIETIAAGGMGIIVSAVDRNGERKVAIKTISPKLYQNPKAIQFFFQECQAIQRMNHPNIVRIYESADEGFLYYVMEFLEGETLEDVLKRDGKLSLDQMIRYGTQVARALQHCHSNRIVHRDIKPSNIFITAKNDVCKIIDFGVVKELNSSVAESTSGVGSPHYASPEQIQGSEVTDKSDVFALGVCLFRMATGEFPYSLFTSGYFAQDPKKIGNFNSNVPQELEEIIYSSIRLMPEERLPANKLWAQLRQVKI